ncbi:MAG: hypothetical protein ACPGNV_15610 [Mangrovicoccus sp.]
MTSDALMQNVEQMRQTVASDHVDPRAIFDRLQELFHELRIRALPVPQDLVDAAAELEGEIVEEFYDNLPV